MERHELEQLRAFLVEADDKLGDWEHSMTLLHGLVRDEILDLSFFHSREEYEALAREWATEKDADEAPENCPYTYGELTEPDYKDSLLDAFNDYQEVCQLTINGEEVFLWGVDVGFEDELFPELENVLDEELEQGKEIEQALRAVETKCLRYQIKDALASKPIEAPDQKSETRRQQGVPIATSNKVRLRSM